MFAESTSWDLGGKAPLRGGLLGAVPFVSQGSPRTRWEGGSETKAASSPAQAPGDNGALTGGADLGD